MTLPNADSIGQALAHLKRIAPGGFAIGLHIRFVAPRLMFNSYPSEWVDVYARRSLLTVDPTVRWGLSRTGARRWEAFSPEEDPDDVLGQAAAHGLRYGVTLSIDDGGRSLAGLARSDRPLEAEEIARAGAVLERLHALTREIGGLDAGTRQGLETMAVAVTGA